MVAWNVTESNIYNQNDYKKNSIKFSQDLVKIIYFGYEAI